MIAKGVGIIGVVAHHLANRRFGEPQRGEIAWLGAICDWAVPLFILVSGFLHGLSHQRKPSTLAHFVSSRTRRLLVPYAIISLVFALLHTALTRTGLLGDAIGHASWYRLWWASLTLTGGVGEQLYFLPLLFLVGVAATTLLHAFRFSAGWLVPLAVAALVIAVYWPDAMASLPGQLIWSWDKFAAGASLYALGFLLSNQPRLFLWFTLAGVVATSVAVVVGHHATLNFVAPIALLGGLQVTRLRCLPLEITGNASGTIFLYHTPFFLQPMLVLIASRAATGWQVPLAYATLPFTIAFFVGVDAALRQGKLRALAY